MTDCRTIVVLGFALSLFMASSAFAYDDRWQLTDQNGLPIATDCSDCEEELGIIIRCEATGRPAKVIVNGAAARRGKDGAEATFLIKIDGQVFEQQASTVEFGLIGFTPEFYLAPDNPLVTALQYGNAATIFFNGTQSELSLKGSKVALDSFKLGCGWSEQSGAQQASVFGVQSGEAHTQPDENGFLWYTAVYDAQTSNAYRELRYAVPETDAVAVSVVCRMSDPSIYQTRLTLNYGAAGDGDLVQVAILLDGGSPIIRQGSVFAESSEVAGVEIPLKSQDALWPLLGKAQSFSFGLEGEPTTSLPAPSLVSDYFVSNCS